MKKILTIFFVTLGIFFFVLILCGAYFFVTDPLNLKPLFFGSPSTSDSVDLIDTSTSGVPNADVTVDKNPALTDSQEKALEKVGIDPAAVPSSITPEQKQCFIDVLGEQRVQEIVAGDTPTAAEIFMARNCI